MSDVLAVLPEVRRSPDLPQLHPLKLDRWHRLLVGLPEAIYMQYGCQALLQHVVTAAAALESVYDILGPDGLAMAPQELAQRTIGTFRWYVPEAIPVACQVDWDKASSSWKLTCQENAGVVKSVPTLEVALEKSRQWAESLKKAPSEEG